jgi:DNA-binding PadR family transcriptional regulator
MIKPKTVNKKIEASGKNSFPFEEDLKELIRGKISEDPDEFIEKMISGIKSHWVFGKRSFLSCIESPDVNPFVNLILTRSGLLPLYTIHLLHEKKMYGSELISEIEKRTSSSWSPNPGSIYPLLKELEEEKLVDGHWDTDKEHPRRIYEITKKGKQEYKLLKTILRKQILKAVEIFEKIFFEIYPEDIKRKRESK